MHMYTTLRQPLPPLKRPQEHTFDTVGHSALGESFHCVRTARYF